MNFDVLAVHYRWMEFLLAGNRLQRCRTAFLDQVTHCQRVLLVGEGNGRFLLACRRQLPAAQITCLDSSALMLHQARKRLGLAGENLDGVVFLQADILKWKPPPVFFDLVVTHFFLDCFCPDGVEKVVARLASATCSTATWLVSDFQIPADGLLRSRAQAIHWVMYAFFRVVVGLPARRWTAPDRALKTNHFALRQRHISEWGLLRTDKWERERLTARR